MKNIILFLFLLLNVNLLAESKVTFVPYISYANYDGSTSDTNSTDTNSTIQSNGPIKNDAIIGLYSLIDDGYQSIEFSVELKYLKYTSGEELTQINLATSYKKYLLKNLKLNTLLHYISNNIASNGATIALVGLDYISENDFTLGIESAYSSYGSNSLADKILQIKPSASFAYGHKNSDWGVIYPGISMYYIKPYSQNTSLNNSYFSTELDLTHKKGSFTTKLQYWFGEQLYAVRDDGFTIYNLNEVHNSGTALSMHYKVDNSLGIKTSYISEYYTRIGSTSEEYMDRLLFVADFSF